MSLSINCLFHGDFSDKLFSVNVDNTAFVMKLIQEIKNMEPRRLGQVGATELELRMVNLGFDDLESELANLRLDDYPGLSSITKVSSFFPNGNPLDNRLHIIVIAPGPLTLFCAVEAEEIAWNDVFPVKIDSRMIVGDLKIAIKETKKPDFDHIAADRLTLFNVSMNAVPDEILKVDLKSFKPLLQKEPLSKSFPYVEAGYLHIIIRVPIAGEEGRHCISALHKRFQDVLSSMLKPTPSSESEFLIYDGRYKENNPRTSIAPPVQLFHPSFARFLNDLTGTKNIPNDIIRATTDYMKASSAIYTTAEKRRAELTPILCEILGVDIQTILYDDQINDDGVVELVMMVGRFLMFLNEDKNANVEGGLDPSTHAGLYLGRSWAQPKFEKIRNATNCPTFVVATAGPWIVILGAVFTDGLIVHRLTDYIWVGLDSSISGGHISRVARVFYALKNGMENLKSYYEAVGLSDDSPAESRYFPSINAYRIGEDLIHFRYVGFLEDGPDCITLRAQTLTIPPRDIVVKFVDRYGKRAHRLLADNGLAPELIYCGSPHLDDKGPSYDSLCMVIMGFIDGQTLGKSKLKKEEAENIHWTLKGAFKLLHDNGLVFGDVRSPNVMITPAKEVKLIDFDWAGEEGQARYPHLISPAIPWPAGVQPLAVIERGHDVEMLENMFSGRVPFITRP